MYWFDNDKQIFEGLFGKKTRQENDKLEQFHMDIAASIQVVLEQIILKITKSLSNKYKIKTYVWPVVWH